MRFAFVLVLPLFLACSTVPVYPLREQVTQVPSECVGLDVQYGAAVHLATGNRILRIVSHDLDISFTVDVNNQIVEGSVEGSKENIVARLDRVRRCLLASAPYDRAGTSPSVKLDLRLN